MSSVSAGSIGEHGAERVYVGREWQSGFMGLLAIGW
jgi:hypothetical protein